MERGPPHSQSDPLLYQSLGPLDPWKSSHLYQLGVELSSVPRRKAVVMYTFKTGWGLYATAGWPTAPDRAIDELAHQLPRDDGCASGLQRVPVRAQGALCPGPIGQHDSGSLYKLPSGSQVLPSKQAGALPPSMGTVQPPLSESGSCPRLHGHWSGYAILERTIPQGSGDSTPRWSA